MIELDLAQRAQEQRDANKRRILLAIEGYRPRIRREELDKWLIEHSDRILSDTHTPDDLLGVEYKGEGYHWLIIMKEALEFDYTKDARFSHSEVLTLEEEEEYPGAVFNMLAKDELCVCCGSRQGGTGIKTEPARSVGIPLKEWMKANKVMIRVKDENEPENPVGQLEGSMLYIKVSELKGVAYKDDKRYIENKVKRLDSITAQCAVFRLGG